MTAAAAAARRSQVAQFGVDFGGRTGWAGAAQPMNDRQRLAALGIAQPITAGGVLSDRFAHNLALRLAQARRRSANLGDCLVAQGERDPDHTGAILPY